MNPAVVTMIRILLTLWLLILTSYAQITQTDFGKNRVQYRDFEWQVLEGNRVRIYFYTGSQKLARWLADSVHNIMQQVEEFLQLKEPDITVNIILFNRLEELRQSNIGRGHEFWNIGWITQLSGNKMFLYYNGNMLHLTNQFKENYARILLQNSLLEGSIQNMVSNMVMQGAIPQWFSIGFLKYIGWGWTPEDMHKLRAWLERYPNKDFSHLQNINPELAGKSFWVFIEKTYGKEAVVDLLHMARINKGVFGAVYLLWQQTPEELFAKWKEFIIKFAKQSQQSTSSEKEEPITRWKAWKWNPYQVSVDRRGETIAMTLNRLGRWKIKVFTSNNEKIKRKTLKRGGYKTYTFPEDPTMPLVAVAPSGSKIVAVYYKRGIDYIMVYDVEKRKKDIKRLKYFQKVHSFAFGPSERFIVLSAVQRGRTDLFLMNLESHHIKRLTSSPEAEVFPATVKTANYGTGFVFWKNGSVPGWYFIPMKNPSREILIIPDSVQRFNFPMRGGDTLIALLDRFNDKWILAHLDSILIGYDTLVFFKGDSMLINPQIDDTLLASVPNSIVDSVVIKPVFKDTAYLYEGPDFQNPLLFNGTGNTGVKVSLHKWKRYQLSTTKLKWQVGKPFEIEPIIAGRNKQTRDTIPEVWFITPQIVIGKGIPQLQDKLFDGFVTRRKRPYPYFPRMSTQFVISQLDNSIYFTPYQPLATMGTDYPLPDLSPVLQYAIADLMEDYRFWGGLRISTNLKNIEYFLVYESARKRIDHKFLFYHRSLKDQIDLTPFAFIPVPLRIRTHLLQHSIIFPFSEPVSFRLHYGIRYDRVTVRSVDLIPLVIEDIPEWWGFIKSEFVVDNSLPLGTNLREGFRGKVWIEGRRRVTKINRQTPVVEPQKDYFFVIGLDARYYIRWRKLLISAIRVAGGHSFGPRRVLFTLGGVDSWLNPSFSTETPFPEGISFGYMAIATPLRGFPLNIRNGDSYAMFSIENRWQIFRDLNWFKSSTFMQNLQLITFADAGMAWVGTDPFAEDAPHNQQILQSGPITLIINYYQEPYIYSIGWGVRMILLGYFFRVDVAYPIVNNQILPSRLLFSLSVDF